MTTEDCDHGYSTTTGAELSKTKVYTRRARDLFRKKYWWRCWDCDLKEPV